MKTTQIIIEVPENAFKLFEEVSKLENTKTLTHWILITLFMRAVEVTWGK